MTGPSPLVPTALPPATRVAVERCAACPKMCRSVCPTLAITANERHQPWGRATLVAGALRGRRSLTDSAVVDSLYACATCASCTVPCAVEGVETPEVVWSLRAAVAAAGATPAVGQQAVAAARAGQVLAGTNPPRWQDPEPTLRALRALADPNAETLLLPGCGALGRRPAAALAAARALRRLGQRFRAPERHRCCGRPALSFGDPAAATAMLAEFAAGAATAGIRRVAVQSPSCAWMLGQRAPLLLGRPLGVEVVPLAALLATTLGAPPRRRQRRRRVAYHDPCYLSRYLEVEAPPRQALTAAGYEVVELPHRGRWSRCSGQGGGLALTHPDIASGYLARLAAEVEGAPAVVTGCASCAAALTETGGPPVADLAEAVAEVLGVGEEGW